MRTTWPAVITGATLVSTFALVGCSSESQVVEYATDYPQYTSLTDLCAAATAVVVGQPISTTVQEVTVQAGPGGASEAEDPSLNAPGAELPADFTMVKTVTEFQVEVVLHGSGPEPGQTISIGELGGDYKGMSYRAEQYGVADKDRQLLFLNIVDGAPASLLNPGQGGYEVKGDGTLRPAAGNRILGASGKAPAADATLCAAPRP